MALKKPHRLRVVLLGGCFAVLSGLVGARLVHLQHTNYEHYSRRADGQHLRKVEIQPERGTILDRNGNALAQSTGRLTVYINPRFLSAPVYTGDVAELALEIADAAGMERTEVESRIAGGRVTALAKRLRPEHANRVMAVLREAGVDSRGHWLHRESIRLYPRHLAAPVIGFCRSDADGHNDGIAGVELAYNAELSGTRIVSSSMRTGISQSIDPWEPEDLLRARGNTLVLTLDANIQESLDDILLRHAEKWEADAAGAVIMDVNDGSIVAMSSYPTFDNNNFSTADPDSRRNRTLTDPLETGSVAKLFMASMLVDQGFVTPETTIDCEGGFAVVDGRRLRDSPGHYLDVATFREVMRWSSNIGIVKVALSLDNETWYDYLRAFGFGSETGIDLPGEGAGILYPVERWTRLSRTSLPMGYEIALTPLQTTAALAALVNGGQYFQPHVVSEIRDPHGNTVFRRQNTPVRQVIRPTTSAIMRELMEDIVVNGTGKKAQVEGYRIGGKTGTTRKSNVFTHREYIASFGGAFPIHQPRVAVYLYIDNPKGAYYASTVAAPAFQEIVRSVALHLGIAPSEELLTRADETTDSKEKSAPTPVPDSPVLLGIGAMPDLRGLSMARARTLLPEHATRVRFLGSGVVTDQYPAPGHPVGEASDIVLHFSPRPAELTNILEIAEQNRGNRRR